MWDWGCEGEDVWGRRMGLDWRCGRAGGRHCGRGVCVEVGVEKH